MLQAGTIVYPSRILVVKWMRRSGRDCRYSVAFASHRGPVKRTLLARASRAVGSRDVQYSSESNGQWPGAARGQCAVESTAVRRG